LTFNEMPYKIKIFPVRLTMRKVIVINVLILGVILSISSCATAPTRPLAPGEVRLLKMDVPLEGDTKRGLPFMVSIHFEAEGRPEIKRACFYMSGDGPYCFKITNVKYGHPGIIEVEIRPNQFGSYLLKGYVLYLRDGKTQLSNQVTTLIHIIP